MCLLVHGNLVTEAEAIQEASRAVSSLCPYLPAGERATFVLMSWPSEEEVPLLVSLDVAIKASRSDATAYYLAWLLAHLPPEQHVCLIGYSHGARAVAGALELLSGGEVAGRRLPHVRGARTGPARIRAALVVAAMDHDWLRTGQRYGHAPCRADAMLLVNNHSDEALAFYPLRKPFSARALGREGLSRLDWQRLGAHAAKVTQVDVAPVVGKRHNWSVFTRSETIAQLLAPFVSF